MKVYLLSPYGSVKKVKVGFSWTVLFFDLLVPLFRFDFTWFFIMAIFAMLTSGLSWLVMPFIYNRAYIKKLIRKGYRPADEYFRTILIQKRMII